MNIKPSFRPQEKLYKLINQFPTVSLLYLIAVIPVISWLSIKNILLIYTNTPWLEVSRFFGLLALGSIVAALLVILKQPGYIPVIRKRLFARIDHLYIHHQILMNMAVIFAFIHYLALLLQYQGSAAIADLLLPGGNNTSATLGFLALLLMATSISVTYITRKLKYRLWAIIHSIFSISFLVGVLHILNVQGDLNTYLWLKIVTYIYVGMGLLLWVYRVLLRLIWKKTYGPSAIVQDVKQLNQRDVLITIKPNNSKLLSTLKPGHYIFMKLPNITPFEHPFTVVNTTPTSIELVIRKYKGHTKNITSLKGKKVFIKGPFGTLPEQAEQYENIVCFSAGVGITPALGLLNLYKDAQDKNLRIFYVTRDSSQDTLTSYIKSKDVNASQDNMLIWYTTQNGRPKQTDIVQYLKDLSPKKTLIAVTGPPSFINKITSIIKSSRNNFNIYNENIEFNRPLVFFLYINIAILLTMVNIIVQSLINRIGSLRQ